MDVLRCACQYAVSSLESFCFSGRRFSVLCAHCHFSLQICWAISSFLRKCIISEIYFILYFQITFQTIFTISYSLMTVSILIEINLYWGDGTAGVSIFLLNLIWKWFYYPFKKCYLTNFKQKGGSLFNFG